MKMDRNPYCFIVQPFNKDETNQTIYKNYIIPAAKMCQLEVKRADQEFGEEYPIKAMESMIRDSSVVIADISYDNQNVWYELGYATAISKPTILLCNKPNRNLIPFDIRDRGIISYELANDTTKQQLLDKLEKAIRRLCPEKNKAERNIARQSVLNISTDDILILKIISKDQKTPFDITPEEKLEEKLTELSRVIDIKTDGLRTLIRNGFLEFHAASDGKRFYQLTDKTENLLSNL